VAFVKMRPPLSEDDPGPANLVKDQATGVALDGRMRQTVNLTVRNDSLARRLPD